MILILELRKYSSLLIIKCAELWNDQKIGNLFTGLFCFPLLLRVRRRSFG